jgi:hypothetical protein
MAEQHYMPDPDRLSVLSAAVLLAYALSSLVKAPEYTLGMQLPGLYLALSINLNTVTTLLAAGLAATGMEWLLRGHPRLEGRPTFEHWLLPMLTTFVIGAPLSLVPPGTAWWLGFSLGAILLVLVFLAEYIVVDPAAPNYALATAGLTALSFGLFLILAAALRYAGTRLLLIGPALFIAAGLVSLRSLRLRLGGRWHYAWAAGIALVCLQLGAGLHYWPIPPISFALLLLGPLYSLTTLTGNLLEDIPLQRAVIEPLTILVVSWGLALWPL